MAGYELGKTLTGLESCLMLALGGMIFYAILFFYQTHKLKQIRIFLRSKNLLGTWDKYVVDGKAGKYLQKEEIN